MILGNAQPVPVSSIPEMDFAFFRDFLIGHVAKGARLNALFARPDGDGEYLLTAILAFDKAGELAAASARVWESYKALTPEIPQAHMFEREIAETYGVVPKGHLCLNPVRFIKHGRTGTDLPTIGVTDYYRIEGEQIHEVAVGPVHAGVIEPGHFRFQCNGEKVLNLEISHGYQHRGVESALLGALGKRTIPILETVAGDTTIGHATAGCMALEAIAGVTVPERAQAIRAVALEMERLANHAGDLGYLAQDIGYLPTSAFCGRLRGDFLNLTQRICGNRFGRGLMRLGGVGFDIGDGFAEDLALRLEKAGEELKGAVGLLWGKPSVLSRIENTGVVSHADCKALGLTGPPARACGEKIDVRANFPAGAYSKINTPIASWNTGDVFARAKIRWLEAESSVKIAVSLLRSLPAGQTLVQPPPLRPDMFAVALVEGWRGEIAHAVTTGPDGAILHYKIVDPSFHNWEGLAIAMRGAEISDFPLCNKSFNLSYCGFDL